MCTEARVEFYKYFNTRYSCFVFSFRIVEVLIFMRVGM
jgi:hypothetical protein